MGWVLTTFLGLVLCADTLANTILPCRLHLAKIGRSTQLSFFDENQAAGAIAAKIDTGAAISSVHATDITELGLRDGQQWVRFTLHTQHGLLVLERPILRRAKIKSSNGRSSSRIVVELDVSTSERPCDRFPCDFTLADRSKMNLKALAGRNLLAGRFVVDSAIPPEGKRIPGTEIPVKQTILGQVADLDIELPVVGGGVTSVSLPSRVDTGAVWSTLNALNLRIEYRDGVEWAVFDVPLQPDSAPSRQAPGQPATVRVEAPVDSWDHDLKSSNGDVTSRPLIKLRSRTNGHPPLVRTFSVADRSTQTYPVLLGETYLVDHFLVDPALD